jgi:hypothetical protein
MSQHFLFSQLFLQLLPDLLPPFNPRKSMMTIISSEVKVEMRKMMRNTPKTDIRAERPIAADERSNTKRRSTNGIQ